MIVKKYYSPPLQENTFLIYSEKTLQGYIIDPGSKPEEILNFINQNKIKIKAILNTHGHFDHTIFNQYFVNELDIPVHIDEKDIFYTKRIKDFKHLYNNKAIPFENYELFKGNLILENQTIEIIKTPGHTIGGISYYIPSENILFTGDTLFKRAFGRYDLPKGNFEDLKNSIRKLFALPDNTLVYAGHGEETTIGEEKRQNYILKFI